MITLPPMGDLGDALWLALLEISERHPQDWTLIGGQMVLLHALEQGAQPPRISRDLDVVADARVRPSAVQSLAEALVDLGFTLGPAGADGVAHRFTRGPVSVDLLAPEGLGPRADLRVEGSVKTTEIRGGTYALARSGFVDVRAGDRVGHVPLPDLAGALVVKASAARADRRRGPERHLGDLALLLSLVSDPFALAEELTSKQRTTLRRVRELADREHRAWRQLDPPSRATGAASFELLCGS